MLRALVCCRGRRGRSDGTGFGWSSWTPGTGTRRLSVAATQPGRRAAQGRPLAYLWARSRQEHQQAGEPNSLRSRVVARRALTEMPEASLFLAAERARAA
eukprot:13828478-Alexandrium_andersonii.AAC.2